MTGLWIVVASFLLSSIPFGLIVGKLWGSVDVRQHGSGNIGTSNVTRTVGKGAGALVLVLDTLKGAVPVWAAVSLGLSDWVVAGGGVAAVAGHMWSAFLKFKGGKGVATTLGVLIAIDYRLALALLAVWLVVVAATRYISVGSLVAALCLPVFLWLFGHGAEYVTAGVLICLLIVWRHRSNIERLRAGTEFKVGERVAAARVGRR